MNAIISWGWSGGGVGGGSVEADGTEVPEGLEFIRGKVPGHVIFGLCGDVCGGGHAGNLRGLALG